MIIKITNYAYYNIFDNEYDKTLECPVLVITGRDSEGKFHSIKVPGNKGIYRPHFYVEDTPYNRALLSELEHQKTILEWEEWPYPSVYDENEKVLILYTKYPFEVKKLRKKFDHTYEADVRYEYMFMMKLKLDQGYLECPDREWINPDEIKKVSEEDYFLVEPRIFYFDIETDKIDKSEKFSINNSLVISIVLYDNYLNQYDVFEWSENNGSYWKEERTVKRGIKNKGIPVTSKEIIHHCRNEKVLLRNFFECFKRRPDALFTFNGHGGYRLTSVKSNSIRIWRNGFDEPVVYIRALANDLEREIQWMSPLPRVKNVYGNYYGVYNRGKGDKFEVVIRGLTPLDFYYAAPLMQYTAKYRDFFGESLDNYLQYFAGIGKVEHEGLTVAELKEIDLETEIKYNRRDVEGCLFLDKRFGFSNDIFETVTISMVNGIDVLSATRIHKFITLYESQDYCVYDTQYQGWQRDVWKGWIKERVGGYVVPIKKGVGGWTVVIDFSQLYPSIASASNAGIDTLIEVERETDEVFIDKKGRRWNKEDCIITPSAPFRTDKVSIEKKIWDKLITYRNKFKAKLAKVFAEVNGDTDHPKYKLYWAKQYNLKTRLINNKFGANGNPGFLNYCLPVYNTAPSTAQRLIKGIEKELMPKIKYELRGGDTDSVFVALKSDNIEDCIKETEEIVDKVNKFIDIFVKREFNIGENRIHIGWEKIGRSFYGHKKKNYSLDVWADADFKGYVLPEDKRHIMYKGFELKKGDRADITEKVQKTYLKIAHQVGEESGDKEEFRRRIEEFIKRADNIFKYLPISQICKRATLKKKLDEYQENYYLRRAAITAGKKLNRVYGLGSNGFLAWLKNNGNSNLQSIIFFKKEDEKKMKDLNLDYDSHKQKYMINKLDLLLEDFNTSYYNILRAGKIKSAMAL